MNRAIDSFIHHTFRTRVVAQPHAISLLRGEIDALGCSRPLLLTSASVARSGVLDEVRRSIADLSSFFIADISQHPTARKVSEVLDSTRAEIDCVVAAGGGSVLDTAKAIIYSMAAGKPLEQLMGDEECKPSQREV